LKTFCIILLIGKWTDIGRNITYVDEVMKIYKMKLQLTNSHPVNEPKLTRIQNMIYILEKKTNKSTHKVRRVMLSAFIESKNVKA